MKLGASRQFLLSGVLIETYFRTPLRYAVMGYKYTLAHGAKQNVGDFLIRDRAIALLDHYLGVSENELHLTDLVRTQLTVEELSTITKTDAVIIAGGPGYQPDFYPGVYPSLNEILDAGVPIYPLGPGWKGVDESSYEFTASSKDMLRRIHERIKYGGTRDLPTKRVVERLGIDNVKLTGCPAWHDLNRTNESFNPPDSVSSLVVSSPAKGSYRYGPQWTYLLYRLAKRFPDATRYCSFHQGVDYTPGYNTRRTATYNHVIKRIAQQLGYEILDPSGQPEKLGKYRDIDIHVGYRVHAHIPFLANGQPSFLIHQDGRGTGVSEALRTQEADVTGFRRRHFKVPVDEVLQNIDRNLDTGFADFDSVDAAIVDARMNMEKLIRTLP